MTLPITTYRAMTVDDQGRIFIAGDDKVLVYSESGTLLATIGSVYGAGAMDIKGGFLFVSMTTAGRIGIIDLSTYSLVLELVLGTAISNGGIAVLSDAVWYLVDGDPARYVYSTGTASVAVAGSWSNLTRIPGDDTAVLVNSSDSNGTVRKLSTLTPFGSLGSFGANGYLADLAVDPTDRLVWTASGSPYTFPEWNLTTMTATGRIFPAAAYPSAIDFVEAAGGGVIAGSTRGRIYVARTVAPVTTHVIDLPAQELSGAVELAPDASHVHAVISGSGTTRLYSQPLAPIITTTGPSTVVADVPTMVTVTGTGLTDPSSVTFGGVEARIDRSTPSDLVLETPLGIPAGVAPLVITTEFGTVTRNVNVAVNTGARLTGTIRRGTGVVAGVELTIDSASLTAPRTATSDSLGAYSFTGLPWGDDYEVTVHHPSGPTFDYPVGPLELRPNGFTTLNLDLDSPQVSGPVRSTVGLPSGTVRDLVVEPATGRVFVTVGNEVAAYDPDGRLLARRSLGGAVGDLTVGDGSIWVSVQAAATVVRIDPASLQTTGSWPMGSVTNGAIAHASGRVWFMKGDNQWTSLSALDPQTGSVQQYIGSLYVPRLRTVDGDPHLLLVSETSLSPPSSYVYDTVSGAPSLVRSLRGLAGPVAADATTGNLWSRDGTEYGLSDLTATGLVYPASGNSLVESSTARGGLLVVGRNVMRQGTPAPTHTVAANPVVRPGFSPDGTRLYTASTAGTLVVTDLTPYLDPRSGTIGSAAQSLTLTGHGLGTITGATLDGAPLVPGPSTPSSVTLPLPALADGPHTIGVTTPWGTTSIAVSVLTPPPPPVVSSASPGTVAAAGGTAVTISGTGFTGATQVRLGGTNVAFTVVDDTTITATAPPSAPRTGSVVVVGPGGTSTGGPSLTWVSPVPEVTGLSPATGPSNGGTTVTLSGSGFLYASAVSFGSTSASFTVVDDDTITAVAPAGSIGSTVAVTVTTPGGTSAVGPTYGYLDPLPTVTSVSPSSGPTAGGALVTVKGANLLGVTSVRVGGTPALFSVVDQGAVVVLTPPGAAGVGYVEVTAASGTSARTLGSRYTYVAPTPGTLNATIVNSAGPLAGMVVVLSAPDRLQVIAHRVSGADGRVTFTGVAPGEYRVLTLDPGVFAGAPTYHLAELYDDHPFGVDEVASSTPVVVGSGAVVSLTPISLAHSRPGGVHGVVRNAGRHPVAGVEVHVSRAGQPDIVASTVTGPDGTYAVGGLAPGDYRVVVTDPTGGYLTEWYDGTTGAADFSGAATVGVGVGQDVGLALTELVHTDPATLTGRVETQGGDGIPGMWVLISHPTQPAILTGVATGPDGSFTLAGIAPGEYVVLVVDPRPLFGIASVYKSEFFDDVYDFHAAAPVSFGPGEVVSIGVVDLAPVA